MTPLFTTYQLGKIILVSSRLLLFKLFFRRHTHGKFTARTWAQDAKLQARGEKNGPEERCETKGQENVTLNKVYEHNGAPEPRI
jgi:hypothetical protein